MATKFKEILKLCENRGFLNGLLSSKIPSEISLGPVGYILQENLKTEWLHANVTNRDISVFLNEQKSLFESYNFVKDICNERLPFGFAQVFHCEGKIEPDSMRNEIDSYFHIKNQVQLQTLMFVSPSTSSQYFYTWQRQRRVWWRKFSVSPGRYALTDIQTSAAGEQSIEITSTYPWGTHVIETIRLNPNGHESLTKDQLLMKDGRKRVQAHCVSSVTHLSTMVLNTLCDAYDQPVFEDVSRPLLRFHRKIAPYKISFAISTTNAANTEELNELALYLCKKLRANHVSVLLLPTTSRMSLDAQWCQYDQLGIPYCVLLNDSTLKNGIANLRNRDTKLKEQVHISDLPTYVDQLFKNY